MYCIRVHSGMPLSQPAHGAIVQLKVAQAQAEAEAAEARYLRVWRGGGVALPRRELHRGEFSRGSNTLVVCTGEGALPCRVLRCGEFARGSNTLLTRRGGAPRAPRMLKTSSSAVCICPPAHTHCTPITHYFTHQRRSQCQCQSQSQNQSQSISRTPPSIRTRVGPIVAFRPGSTRLHPLGTGRGTPTSLGFHAPGP
jgi:hypothetical protein